MAGAAAQAATRADAASGHAHAGSETDGWTSGLGRAPGCGALAGEGSARSVAGIAATRAARATRDVGTHSRLSRAEEVAVCGLRGRFCNFAVRRLRDRR